MAQAKQRKTVAVRVTRVSEDTNQFGNYCYSIQSANVQADNIVERDGSRLVWSREYIGATGVPINITGVIAPPRNETEDNKDKVYLNLNNPNRSLEASLKAKYRIAQRMAVNLKDNSLMDKAGSKMIDVLFGETATPVQTAPTPQPQPQPNGKEKTELELAQEEWDEQYADLDAQLKAAKTEEEKKTAEEAILQLGDRPA